MDLAFIASLYGKSEEAIIAELGDLIFQDPESRAWQTADAYLSGNVRAKLAAGRERRARTIARNAEALRAVQPEDILPGDIDANLGAPWIPEERHPRRSRPTSFGVSPSAIRVGHLKKDAVWSLDCDYAVPSGRSPRPPSLAPPRANGTWLLELALNLKTPVIYDTVTNGDREERVVNQEATLAARDKQAQIKDRFRAWVFSEPEPHRAARPAL